MDNKTWADAHKDLPEYQKAEQKTNSALIPLLACPFCAGKNVIYVEVEASIYCNDCPGQVQDYYMTKGELFAAWNKREK